jgi:Amt family ammonium transporter
MPETPGSFSGSDAIFCVVCIFLVPFAAAGLGLINTGLSRSRNAAHSMLAALCVFAAAVLVFGACGFAIESGNAARWIGDGPLFLRGLDFNSPAGAVLLLELFGAALAAMIPLAAGGERWRLAAICVSTAVLTGWTYPLFAHWMWGGGWLARQGFMDSAGGSSIQVVGGLTALSIAWILGPRRGKFTSDGVPTAMPGHNAVIVLFGCMLALVGWIGLNSAGGILFGGAKAIGSVGIAINTVLAAAAAAASAVVITRVRFGKPDASLAANGWVAGLVASSAGCAIVKPASAVFIGAVAGAVVILAIELFELRMKVDDPAGAISVHAVGGIWGVLAIGMFGPLPGQLLAQLIGVATLIGLVLPMSYGLNWLLDRVLHQRVAAEGERQGMDLFELGAGAYPDFVTHREDLMRR